MLRRRWQFPLFLIPLLFLILFFFYPLGNILGLSLTVEAVSTVLDRSYFAAIIAFTAWQALLSTALTMLIGVPAAYIFARYQFPLKSLLRALFTVPFVMPTVVVAAAFRALLGPSGPVNDLLMSWLDLARAPIRLERTLTIILIAHVFYNVSIVVRLLGGFWANLSPRLVEAAQMLGASPLQAFRRVTLPVLSPALFGAGLLVYLFTFTSFGVVLLLGGPQYSTIETEIYRQYVTFLNLDVAALLSLFQIVFTFVLMSIYARWQRKGMVPIDFRPHDDTSRRPTSGAEKIVIYGMLSGLSLLLVLPLAALLWRSLSGAEGEFTLAHYLALPESRRGSITFIPPLAAIRNSLGYALLTVVAAGGLGLISASWLSRPGRWRAWLDPVFMLPLGASAVTLGFGYVVSFDRLRTSPMLVLIAHTLVALPFVVRAILPVQQGIPAALREAASVLGASPRQVWRRVDLPIVGRALLVGAVFAFTVSMGEFGATSFIVRPNSGYLTVPIAIQRFLGQAGSDNFGQALAMSAILMLVCAAGFIAIERFRVADVGEF